jgi:hypothetical protein
MGGVIGPLVSGRIIEVGGFGLAGPWSAFLAGCAFLIAWRVLPHHVPADSEQQGEAPVVAA